MHYTIKNVKKEFKSYFLIKSFFKLNLNIFKTLLKIFPKIILRFSGFDVFIFFKKKYCILNLKILKLNTNFLFTSLLDISIIDYPWKINRFHINYIMRSMKYCRLIYIYIKTCHFKPVFSITDLYHSSFWVERECWDLFGIFFLNHKNLKRILTDYGFKGHPLKKDFPLTGYKEIFFDSCSSNIKYKNITYSS